MATAPPLYQDTNFGTNGLIQIASSGGTSYDKGTCVAMVNSNTKFVMGGTKTSGSKG